MQELIFGSVFRALAMVGPYVIPIGCVGAAVMSSVGRQHRRESLARTTGGNIWLSHVRNDIAGV